MRELKITGPAPVNKVVQIRTDMAVNLRCRVGDLAICIKGKWAGVVVSIEAYELVEDFFHWVVLRQGGVFTFPETDHPDSKWGRAHDPFWLPLRPDPESAADDLALFEPIEYERAVLDITNGER